MTIAATTNRTSQDGNGATTAFPFNYPFHAQADLVVISTVIATGVQTTKALTTHYTISGSTDAQGHYTSGGTVNFITAPASTERITIYRDPTMTQGVDLTENDPLPVNSSVESPLDRLTMIVQRLSDRLNRSLRQPEGDAADIDLLPAKVTRASMYLAFDADGDPVATSGTSSAQIVSAFMETVLDDITAAAARLTLGLPAIAAKGDLIVGTAADTLAKKAVGADGTALIGLAGSTDGLYYQPGALEGWALIGGYLTASVAANALTIAIKTSAGNDPSATEPVWVPFRHATLTNGTAVFRKITAATSFVLSAGSTLGFTTSFTSRLYVVGLDNAGTVELGIYHPLAPSTFSLVGLHDASLVTSTAEGGAGAADAAQSIYSTTARASVACRILGYIEVQTGATAGNWSNAPTKIQVMGPGVPRTGALLQMKQNYVGTVATGTTTIPSDNTIPQQSTEGDQYMTQAITPTNAVNLLIACAKWNGSSGVAGSNTMTLALFQDSTENALKSSQASATASGIMVAMALRHVMQAATTSATTFKAKAGADGAGTTSFNGAGGTQRLGGVLDSFINVEEVFV